MTPRPSSPTSLLWAHQIKREHGHLLVRVQKLESVSDQHESRLKHAETAAKSHVNDGIPALAEQVKALHKSGLPERLAKVEKDVMSRLDYVQADNEAMTIKVASLEKDEAVAEEERRKAFNKEKALLKRVAEAEEGLKKYEQSLERMGRRVDEQSIGTIRAQLDKLSEQVKKEGPEMEQMGESIITLERANAELRNANDGLAVEVQKLAAKSAAAAAAANAQVASLPAKKAAGKHEAPGYELDDEIQTPQPPLKKKKQSHKWAGGGADKDIIRQNGDVKRTPRPIASPYNAISKPTQIPPPTQTAKSASKAALKPTPKPAPKPASKSALKPAPKPVPSKAREKATPSQTQRKAAASQKAAVKKGPATAVPANSQRHLDGQPDRPIVRAGKGWVEVAVTPSQSEDESEDEIVYDAKTLRDRPRKTQSGQEDLQVTNNTQRPTRSTRQQPTQIRQQAKPRPKRAIDPQPDPPSAAPGNHRPNNAMQAMKATQKGAVNLPIFDQAGGILSSPPHHSIERRDTKDFLLATVVTSQSPPHTTANTSATRPPPPPPRDLPKRRRIIELDEH
ncbi:hypothetical protein B0A55_00993 [Friedmanniomyces simplex]|uniref:Uncharacterized protein n=1 Tax=Friedmanniomyces simplex TaxID=329884 RepID=A0A4U0Y187_9PEZI|nr:hypothetical protein B0A55_00993 [Friedmanniomyces simplex]